MGESVEFVHVALTTEYIFESYYKEILFKFLGSMLVAAESISVE